MPTYAFWTRAGRLTPDQRRLIAKSITETHHDVARAPRYFVQVVFNELQPHSHFIAGEEAAPSTSGSAPTFAPAARKTRRRG